MEANSESKPEAEIDAEYREWMDDITSEFRAMMRRAVPPYMHRHIWPDSDHKKQSGDMLSCGK